MPGACYALLLAADPIGAIVCTITGLLPLGLAWIFIGVIVFSAVQIKSESYAISGIVFIIYSALLIPANLVDVVIQPYLALLIGILITVMLVKIVLTR